MQFVEYGPRHDETVMLLHGGGLSWWNYRDVSEILKNEYRVILPILDGHAGSDRPFTSIEDNAEEIINFIDDNFSGHISMMGGLSLGGQILLEILSRRGDICSAALVESAMVIPQKITNALVPAAFGSGYGMIKNKAFSRMQFRSLRMDEKLFEDYYRDSCAISKEDLISFMKASTSYELKEGFSRCGAKVAVYAGEKETAGILRSARRTAECLPGTALTILPGLYHGQFSMNTPEVYALTVRKLIES